MLCSEDLLKLFIEESLRELEVRLGFIIGVHSFNKIRYTDVSVLIPNTERKQ